VDVCGFVLDVYFWAGFVRGYFMGQFETAQGSGPLSRRIRELQQATAGLGPARVPGVLTSIVPGGSISRPRTVVVPRRSPVSTAARWS
jgi:hypothetical protein